MSTPRKRIAPDDRLEQPDEAADQRRLAAARLADDAERLARARARRTRRTRPARGRSGAARARRRGSGTGSRGARPRAAACSALTRRPPPRAQRAEPPLDDAPPRLLRRVEPAAVEVAGRVGQRPRSGGTSVQASKACGQRGRKWQPAGAFISDGGRPGIAGRLPRAVAVDPRDRTEQPPRVGVLRVVEELVERALLDDPAGVHHDHAIGDVGDDAEVVGDEDDPGRRSSRAGRAARRGSAPGSSRRARSSARRRSAGSASTTAPSRSSRAGACRRRTRAGRRERGRARAECRRAPSARRRARAPPPCDLAIVHADLLGDLLADPVDRDRASSSDPGRPSRCARRGSAAAARSSR